ncbi:NAD(P)-binding protein [Apiospora marii]|uniref:NAD(P)-binding protein n=1 Tax=Apiospora marii TaxID=335849 RepID=A0ABR1R0G8_9PEZI
MSLTPTTSSPTAPLVWLITGCTSGLGERLALHLLRERGDRVIATARGPNAEARLQTLSQAGASVLELDVTDDQTAVRAAADAALAVHGRVDVLVNNAGFLVMGMVEDLAYKDFLAQFETNVFGAIKVIKAMLPHMRERRSGTVVFIGSRAGWIGDGGVSAYCGSKFALGGMAEALHNETQHLGIRTLLVEPGRFRTKLLSTSNMQAATSKHSEYAELSQNLLQHLVEEDQAQQGDPDKLVRILADMVRREGCAAGREVPFRLPVGSDMVADVRGKCEDTLALLGEWGPVLAGTDFDP